MGYIEGEFQILRKGYEKVDGVWLATSLNSQHNVYRRFHYVLVGWTQPHAGEEGLHGAD